jgi:hypothetical protein
MSALPCVPKRRSECSVGAVSLTNSGEIAFQRACGRTAASTFPSAYESATCQAVCGPSDGALFERNFYSSVCVDMLLDYCLNVDQTFSVDVSSGKVVSVADTVHGALIDGDRREDERSTRNYPILYSPICQRGLMQLLTNRSAFGSNENLRSRISARLRSFCTASGNRVFHDEIAAGKNWSFQSRADIPRYDPSEVTPVPEWRLTSRSQITGGDTTEQFLVKQLHRDQVSSFGRDSIVSAVLHIDGFGADEIPPIPRSRVGCGGAGTEDRVEPYAAYAELDFLATTRVITPSGLSYFALMRLFSEGLIDNQNTSRVDCNDTNVRASDLFVIRTRPIEIGIEMNGDTRRTSFVAELRAKVRGVIRGAVTTVPRSTSGLSEDFQMQTIKLQLSDIYVTTPYLPLYENLSCGCFAPFRVDGAENDAPAENNVPGCGGVASPLNAYPKCRVGWNALPDLYTRGMSGTMPETSIRWEAMFFRDVRGANIMLPTALRASSFRCPAANPKCAPPKTDEFGFVLTPAKSMNEGGSGGGPRYAGAIAIDRQLPRNLLLELCACHLQPEVYNAFAQAIATQGLPIDMTDKKVECAFPGCQSSRFPSFNIARDDTSRELVTTTADGAPLGRLNACIENQVIQSMVIQTGDITTNGGAVTFVLSQAVNGVSIASADGANSGSRTGSTNAGAGGGGGAQTTYGVDSDPATQNAYLATDHHPSETQTAATHATVHIVGILVLLAVVALLGVGIFFAYR